MDVRDSVYDLQDCPLDDVVATPEERSAGDIREEVAAFAKVEHEEVQSVLDEGFVNREDVIVVGSRGMELRLMLKELGDVKKLALASAAVG